MKKNIIVICVAILVLGGLEAFALSKGIDGTLFSAVTTMIGGLAGYHIKKARSK